MFGLMGNSAVALLINKCQGVGLCEPTEAPLDDKVLWSSYAERGVKSTKGYGN